MVLTHDVINLSNTLTLCFHSQALALAVALAYIELAPSRGKKTLASLGQHIS